MQPFAEGDPLVLLNLPPGFRFYPTDEELMVQYLCKKIAGQQFSLQVIGEIDLYKFDPWVLPNKAIFGEKEWYFFSPRDRKYPNGSRPNRVAGSGYWKATGTDKVITTDGRKIGIKKALVFYVGRAPRGTKTNWIMHEYRLLESSRESGSAKLDDWVLCRIYKKNSSSTKPTCSSFFTGKAHSSNGSSGTSSSSLYEDAMQQFGPLENGLAAPNIDWGNLGSLGSVPERPSSLVNQDLCVPTIPNLDEVEKVEDEVESRFRTEARDRLYNSRSHTQSSGFWTNGLGTESAVSNMGNPSFPGQAGGGLWFLQ